MTLKSDRISGRDEMGTQMGSEWALIKKRIDLSEDP